MKLKVNNIITYISIFIITLLYLYNCRAYQSQDILFDQDIKPSSNELSKKYYRYDFSENEIAFYEDKNGENEKFYPVIYTNVEESKVFPKYPRTFLKISNVRQDDLRYFVEKLNGEYVFYFEKEGSIIMREYARRYDFDKERHTQDSMRVLSSRLDTDKKIFNYLKKNNIKYKLISKKTDGYYKSEIKILLEANQCYTYITYTPNFIVTNMYYNAKDTLSLRNNFGKAIFRY